MSKSKHNFSRKFDDDYEYEDGMKDYHPEHKVDRKARKKSKKSWDEIIVDDNEALKTYR